MHRQNFEQFVQRDAQPWHREILGSLYDCWNQFNRNYFDGRMTPPYIILTTPACPRSLGDCGPVSGFGGLSQIRIRESLLIGTHPRRIRGANPRGYFRYGADVLLHESIHQWQQEITGQRETSYHGHGRTFRDQCNEIGRKLGLAPVGLKPRGGRPGLPLCSYWPHNVRPTEYYLGAVRGVEIGAPEPIAAVDETPEAAATAAELESQVRAIARHAFAVLRLPEIEELIRILASGSIGGV